MNLKLSHSAITRYSECGMSYFYHYVQGYRAKVQSSALLFGTAIDKSAETYVLTRDFEQTIKVFEDTWKTQEINKKSEDLRFLVNFTYSNKDLDLDLLTKEDWKELETISDNPGEELQKAINQKEAIGYKLLKKQQKILFNFTNWLCLKRKGYLMLKEFKNIIDENLIEVLGTQVKIDLENEEKDSVVGFADFIFRWKGYEKPVIFDLKTSGIDYEDDSVKTSPQLSLYVFSLSEKYENTRSAGYIVLNKNIVKNKKKICKKCGNDGSGKSHKTCDNEIEGKRCHGEWQIDLFTRARSQVIVQEVSEIMVERTIENFNMVNKSIKAEAFPRCFSSCIKYGSIKCNFYDICHANDFSEVVKKNE